MPRHRLENDLHPAVHETRTTEASNSTSHDEHGRACGHAAQEGAEFEESEEGDECPFCVEAGVEFAG
jgi:hypothetical protein